MKQRRRQERRTRKTTVYRKRGFLNHYDFAYAGRDTVNQATKVAPGVIKNASNEINKTVKQNRSNHHKGRKRNGTCASQKF